MVQSKNECCFVEGYVTIFIFIFPPGVNSLVCSAGVIKLGKYFERWVPKCVRSCAVTSVTIHGLT